MNNTFNVKRLWRLFVYEHKSSCMLRNISLLILVYAAAHTALFQLHLFDNISDSTKPFGSTFTMILIIFSPLIFYYPLYQKKNRLLYTMLPASNLEKWISMLINIFIVAPVLITVLCYVCNLAVWALLLNCDIGEIVFYFTNAYSEIPLLYTSLVAYIFTAHYKENGMLSIIMGAVLVVAAPLSINKIETTYPFVADITKFWSTAILTIILLIATFFNIKDIKASL